MLRTNEILVQQTGIRAQQIVETGVRQGGVRRGELPHPEHRCRLRVFLRLADRLGKPPQRMAHPCDRRVERRGFVEVDPGNAQVRQMRESLSRQFTPLESSGTIDFVGCQHI